jgi:hypothetical protein
MEDTMTTSTAANTTSTSLARILTEGYGPGAWHGPDLKAALADVTPELAFWRPAPGRHNIAEIALHHAYYVRAVRGKLSGVAPEPFVVEGDDWYELSDQRTLTWERVHATVESEQLRLVALVSDIESGRSSSPLGDAERIDVTLGITCHAVYHAGQIQLIKRLRTE